MRDLYEELTRKIIKEKELSDSDQELVRAETYKFLDGVVSKEGRYNYGDLKIKEKSKEKSKDGNIFTVSYVEIKETAVVHIKFDLPLGQNYKSYIGYLTTKEVLFIKSLIFDRRTNYTDLAKRTNKSIATVSYAMRKICAQKEAVAAIRKVLKEDFDYVDTTEVFDEEHQ